MSKPLLTFALIAFNHSQFVEEAISAAFKQTYQPLEVILSDDCSQDDTYSIMVRMAEEYNGPHTVRVFRSSQNSGSPAKHVNRIFELSKGEMVVLASADDISLPHRTEEIFKAWDSTGRTALMVQSNFTIIDEHGRSMPNHLARFPLLSKNNLPLTAYVKDLPLVVGATCAWSPKLNKTLGPLPEFTRGEDHPLAFRSLLLGSMQYVPECLVKYRLHGGNYALNTANRAKSLSIFDQQELTSVNKHIQHIIIYETFQYDLNSARQRGLINSDAFCATDKQIVSKLNTEKLILSIHRERWPRRALAIYCLAKCDLSPGVFRQLLLRLLPHCIYRFLKVFRSRISPQAI